MILNPDTDIFRFIPNAPLQRYFRETQQFPCNHTTFTFRHIINDLKEVILENDLFDFFNPYYIVCDEDLSVALAGTIFQDQVHATSVPLDIPACLVS